MSSEAVNITTRQLAARIPADPSAVRRWVNDGVLTPTVVTPGGHYRFNPDEALEQIAQIGRRRKERTGDTETTA